MTKTNKKKVLVCSSGGDNTSINNIELDLWLHGVPGVNKVPNGIVYDTSNGIYYHTNGDGSLTMASSLPTDSLQWALGILNDLEQPLVSLNRTEEENFLTIDDVLAIRERPREFYQGVVDRPVLERVMEVILLQNQQFDELFVVEESPPSSQLLKNFLKAKAKLTLKKIEEQGEIDDIELIEIEAYKQAAYQGKDFEVVRNEAKDYPDYFRYLMIKADKTSISESDKRYFDNLYTNMRNDDFIPADIRSKDLNEDILCTLPYSNKWKFKATIPWCDSHAQINRFFTKTNLSLREYVKRGFDEDPMRLRMALSYDIWKESKPNFGFGLYVADKYGNYAFLRIKGNTMKKLVEKDLKTELKDIDRDIENSTRNCPSNIPNEI